MSLYYIVKTSFEMNSNCMIIRFQYMAISDDKQRIMPTDYDRKTGQRLNYPEAVLLTNPENPNLKGEVKRYRRTYIEKPFLKYTY